MIRHILRKTILSKEEGLTIERERWTAIVVQLNELWSIEKVESYFV